MNSEKAYFFVAVLGIITLMIIFLISKLMSKVLENKKYPKDNLIEILFTTSKAGDNSKGNLKKSYSGKNNSILEIFENALVISGKDREKVYFFSEIALISSFIIMNSWGKNIWLWLPYLQ